MSVQEIFFLNCGKLTVDHGTLTARHRVGVKETIPVISTLLKTSNGYMLFDTGLDVNGLNFPDETWGPKMKTVKEFTKENSILEQLKLLSIEPEEINTVINSHLHWDHCGGNRLFKNAKFFVQKSEFRFALFPDEFESSLYINNHFNHPLNYILLEGDNEIEDNVYVISTPGHTVGHQSLLVKHHKLGNLLLVGDALYSLESSIKLIPPGITNNLPDAYRSMKSLLNIATRENAELIITHEPNFWEVYKKIIAI